MLRVIKSNIMVLEERTEEKKTDSGLFIPQDKIDFSKPVKAQVVSVGEAVKSIKVGDFVYFPPKVGYVISDSTTDYRVFDENEVIAIE